MRHVFYKIVRMGVPKNQDRGRGEVFVASPKTGQCSNSKIKNKQKKHRNVLQVITVKLVILLFCIKVS